MDVSWTIKKAAAAKSLQSCLTLCDPIDGSLPGSPVPGILQAECHITAALELCCWRRFLKVFWTAKRSNQSILKEINPEYSLERLMLKLKLQYFGHLMQRADSLDEAVGWHHQLDGQESEQTLVDSEACRPCQRVRHDSATEQASSSRGSAS